LHQVQPELAMASVYFAMPYAAWDAQMFMSLP